MAYTIENNYTGNGTTRLFSFTFPYLEDTDVKVSLNQVDTTNFEFANATQINFTADSGGETSTQAASGAPKSAVAVRVYRDTNIDNLQGEFFSGSAIRAQDLNNDFNQTLYVSQETQDKVTGMWNDTTETIASTESFVDSNDYIMTAAAIDDRILADIASQALADGKILAGNGSGVAAAVTPSGDVTMANTGAFTIANTSVETGMLAADAVTGAKIADDAIDSEHYANASIDLAHLASDSVDSSKIVNGSIINEDINAGAAIAHSKLANVTGGYVLVGNGSNVPTAVAVSGDVTMSNAGAVTIANDAVEQAMIADDAVGADQLASNAVVNASVASGAAIEFTKLENLDSGKILVGNGSNAAAEVSMSGDATIATTGAVTLAANSVEIGMIECEQTTISDSDSHIPTSGAVVDYVAAQLLPIGGFEAIANKDSFPETIPVAGVVVSIADAVGIVVNGSGTSTTPDTISSDGTVTINNFPSGLNSTTLDSGIGLQVTSTGSSHTYNYHRLLPTTADVQQLSDDVNDFFARYRIASSAPGSSNDEGDLYFNTSTNKMNVYDGSSWGEVTSTGEFKILVLTNQNTTDAPTYNGSIVAYDLKEGSTSGSAASVTTAAQLIVSVNGVIQKPNAGTNPSGLDGFVLSAADEITFCAGPPSGADVFIMLCGSAVSIPTPGDDTVSTAKLQNGAVTLAKVASQAIDEDNLYISNAGSNGQFLQKQTGDAGGLTWATVAVTPTDITVADESSDTTCFPLFVTAATGDLAPKSGSNLTFNSNTGALGATSFTGSGAALTDIDAGATGGGSDKIFWENGQTVTTNYTVGTTFGAACNAMSAGPITINSGITVTVDSGDYWTII